MSFAKDFILITLGFYLTLSGYVLLKFGVWYVIKLPPFGYPGYALSIMIWGSYILLLTFKHGAESLSLALFLYGLWELIGRAGPAPITLTFIGLVFVMGWLSRKHLNKWSFVPIVVLFSFYYFYSAFPYAEFMGEILIIGAALGTGNPKWR